MLLIPTMISWYAPMNRLGSPLLFSLPSRDSPIRYPTSLMISLIVGMVWLRAGDTSSLSSEAVSRTIFFSPVAILCRVPTIFFCRRSAYESMVVAITPISSLRFRMRRELWCPRLSSESMATDALRGIVILRLMMIPKARAKNTPINPIMVRVRTEPADVTSPWALRASASFTLISFSVFTAVSIAESAASNAFP